MKRTPHKIEQQICNDYIMETLSSRQLAERYNLSKSTILKILKRNNITPINHRLVNTNLIENYFETIDSEYKAYFLGFIFADGCVSHNELFIDINEKDIDILNSFKEHIHSEAKITTRIKGKSKMSRIAINNKKFTDHLRKYGIIDNKTENTHNLPVDLIPKELYRHFLRGLIDGDGWVIKTSQNYYKIGFVTFYETVAQDFILLLNGLINEKWTNKIIRRDNRYSIINIQKQSQVKEVAETIYKNSNIFLKRKSDMAREIYENIC